MAASFQLPNALAEIAKNASEIVLEEHENKEVSLQTDHIPAIERRLLIAYHAYGSHNLTQIAAFVGLPLKQIERMIQSPSIQFALKNNHIPCWTGAELIARLSVEAEVATRTQDRIAALKLLMEYRSMTLPEGGSRGFKRIAAKFSSSNGTAKP